MTCDSCGAEVAHDNPFCLNCTTSTPAQNPAAGTLSQDSGWIRWAATGFLVLVAAGGYYTPRGGVMLLAAMPLMLGAMVAALRIPAIQAAVEGWGARFETRRARAAASRGKFARFVTRPVFALASRLWKMPSAVSDAHLRAGVRVAVLSYLFAVTAALLAAAAYIVIGLAIAVLLIAAFSWIVSFANGQSSPRFTSVRRPKGMFPDSTVSNYRKGYEQALQHKDNVAAMAAYATLLPLQDGAFQRGYQEAIDGKRFEPR
jgi:hypothetical protein